MTRQALQLGPPQPHWGMRLLAFVAYSVCGLGFGATFVLWSGVMAPPGRWVTSSSTVLAAIIGLVVGFAIDWRILRYAPYAFSSSSHAPLTPAISASVTPDIQRQVPKEYVARAAGTVASAVQPVARPEIHDLAVTCVAAPPNDTPRMPEQPVGRLGRVVLDAKPFSEVTFTAAPPSPAARAPERTQELRQVPQREPHFPAEQGGEMIVIRFDDLARFASLLQREVRRQVDRPPAVALAPFAKAPVPDAYHLRTDGAKFDVRLLAAH